MSTRSSGTPIAVMIARMKPLPRRHRIAHLRALIRQPSQGSQRRRQLVELLRVELAGVPAQQVCAG